MNDTTKLVLESLEILMGFIATPSSRSKAIEIREALNPKESDTQQRIKKSLEEKPKKG
jgi:DNA-binding cell septation regulator SpoVG